MRWVTASLAGLLVAAPLLAQEPVQREHVVRRGDTLWDLAGFYFSDPFTWPRIYEANTTVVEDPHWIYPEEILLIPGIRGDTEPVPEEPAEVTQVAARPPAPPPARTVFYRSPPAQVAPTASEPTVLSEPALDQTPVRMGQFTSAPFVMDPDDLEVVGTYIRALRENRDVGGDPSAHPQDQIFLGYEDEDDPPEVDARYLLVEVGSRVSGAPGGTRMIQPTAVIRILSLEDEVVVARIEFQYAPVYRDQVAIPLPMFPDFAVEEAELLEEPDVAGEILEFIGDPPLPGLADIGFVNRGSADGIKVGDVFEAFLRERRAGGSLFSGSEELPTAAVAQLRVVRVTEGVSTVSVESMTLPRLEPGLDVRRIRRIP